MTCFNNPASTHRVVNELWKFYSILKWDDTPSDYEGIIPRDCSFLQTVLLSQNPAHELFE